MLERIKAIFRPDGLKQFFGLEGRINVRSQHTEPPVLGTQNFLEAYDSSPWVRAIAGRVAQSVGETQWKLRRSDTGDEIPADHILLRTLRKPNTLMGRTAFMRVTQLSLDLVGDAFWLLVPNALGAPSEFWPIPAHWVRDLPSAARPYFDVSWREWQARVPESDMLWIHDPSPSSPYGRGRGIIQALADEVSGDEYAAKHVNQLFFNRATPEFVVMDADADEGDIRTHERAWNQRLQGLFKAMRPYFTNRKLEFWQPQQMNMENLTLVPLRKFERDIQLQCWGMPPEQLGIIENSNRATIEASDYVYESRLVRPRRQFLADELTLKLAPLYDERIEVEFVDTTPRDKEFDSELMKTIPEAFTVNEIRALTGREPIEDGNVRVVPLNHDATEDLREIMRMRQELKG